MSNKPSKLYKIEFLSDKLTYIPVDPHKNYSKIHYFHYFVWKVGLFPDLSIGPFSILKLSPFRCSFGLAIAKVRIREVAT